MKWATWQNVGIDRMGCAWLVRKHIDPQAEFVFIAKGQPMPADAQAFDVPGARLSHRGGHCSFHTMLAEYRLDDPVLHRIARIIDEADTLQEAALEPASAGLDLVCRGIRLSSPNDQAALDASVAVYDALYAALRDEGHHDAAH